MLVADPSEATRSVLARLISEAGHHVVTAGDAEDAVARFAATADVDLVVIDAGNARTRAIEACARIKDRAGRFLPVVLIAPADASERADGLRAGADDYLARPFDPAELLARVTAQLRVKQAFDAAMGQSRPAPPRPAGPAPSAAQDPMTGAAANRYGMQRLKEEFTRAERYREPLSVMVTAVDADIGPVARFSLIAEVARVLEKTVRALDLIVRGDGDELFAILPNTHFTGALAIAERAVREVTARELALPEVGRVKPRLWIGVACYPSKDITSADDLLKIARAALGLARTENAGNICIYQYQGYIYQPT